MTKDRRADTRQRLARYAGWVLRGFGWTMLLGRWCPPFMMDPRVVLYSMEWLPEVPGEARHPLPDADDMLSLQPPPGAPEKPAGDVPLSDLERELWADLTAPEVSWTGRSARRRRPDLGGRSSLGRPAIGRGGNRDVHHER